MKVSLNTIKQYTDVTLTTPELVAKINTQLGGVEKVTDLGARYKDVIIAKIVTCEKHPNADKLNICMIDDGGVNSVVPRGDDGLIQVVCGAPNVKPDMFVAWLPPTSTVPVTADDDEPFVLDARELRGVLSQGMLASPKELGLGDSHDGILELDPTEWKPSNLEIMPGASFAKAYGLDDTIIDIENKMFTHRPDLFGQIGVAREIAGIQHEAFVSPKWYKNNVEFKTEDGLELHVQNDAKQAVPRFMAVAVKNVTIKPSPVWLQAELVRLGSKPINNIVDVTNYVMLLTAQPTHAYDYDKLRGGKLGTRMAKAGEKITLLNHKSYELTDSDVVIIDGEGPVGLAGIMGGGDSEVTPTTTNIVLEVANFDMYTVRRSSMRHGLFTDALTRFTKGQSPLQNDVVLQLLMQSVFDVAGGEQASHVFDEKDGIDGSAAVDVSIGFINERLGLALHTDDTATLLKNVELDVRINDSSLIIMPPFWRTDLELPEDIVEEVGRLYGFENLPKQLPVRSIRPASMNQVRARESLVRRRLSTAGANEVLTYSFVHENVLRRAQQKPSHAYSLSNALSPDLQYYRLSLLPSLLDKVHMNIKAGYDSFALFELGKVHYKDEMDASEPSVPNEDNHVALVIAYGDKQAPNGAPYFYARKYLDEILTIADYELVSLTDFDIDTDERGGQLTSAYEPDRTAVIVKDNQICGVVGEFKQTVRKAFKLPSYSAGFEINANILSTEAKRYRPLSRFPSISQDVSLKISRDVTYASVLSCVHKTIERADEELNITLVPVSIYQPGQDDTKTITFRLKAVSHKRTLSDDDMKPVIAEVVDSAAAQLNASVV